MQSRQDGFPHVCLFGIYSVPPPPPSVFYDPQLQIICCYIARYYVRKWHVRRGVIKNLCSLRWGGGERIDPLFDLKKIRSKEFVNQIAALWQQLTEKTHKFTFSSKSKFDFSAISKKNWNLFPLPFFIILSRLVVSQFRFLIFRLITRLFSWIFYSN